MFKGIRALKLQSKVRILGVYFVCIDNNILLNESTIKYHYSGKQVMQNHIQYMKYQGYSLVEIAEKVIYCDLNKSEDILYMLTAIYKIPNQGEYSNEY